MNDYLFVSEFRARCEKVVDGDTVDLYIDLGFHSFRRERFRLLKINAPEMKGDSKEAGQASKDFMTSLLMKEGEWPLRIVTKRDPDLYGRWLAEIYTWISDGGVMKEVSVGPLLVEKGFATWYHK
jgi:micrococcal nuclease